jgi:hypothetical protein
MTNAQKPSQEPHDLAGFLTGRYGCLALARAAGEAAAAARRGDCAENILWAKVIATLRHALTSVEASNPA